MQSAPRYRIDSKFQRVWNSNLAWLRHWRESAGLPTGTQGVLVMHYIPAEKKLADWLTPARSLPYRQVQRVLGAQGGEAQCVGKQHHAARSPDF